ncbi:MAG: peptidylprolyl isomerase [Chloroherpetonaceae bacterium]|nr:peptidylprolyl isomerase [Chthonomonadaceae bacterium]MDW8206965.1 peptidylprolyl isomerase [Chloroherpetonaceae bacterium]
MRGTDVMAKVEGQAITRAELTYFWLQTDPRIAGLLGELLAARWKADRGASASYQVSTEEIYRQLYGGGATNFAPTLSAMVTQRLVDILATRKGILVTGTQAQARARELFDRVRQQNGLALSDEEILRAYRVPRDIFIKDMIFQVQVERLLAADIAERNGHRMSPEDWVEVRELFASVSTEGDAADIERRFVEARERIQGWLQEIAAGKSFSEVAREHNENFTRGTGGLRGPTLRGTGTPALEKAIYQLRPGEMTGPLRATNGWYVFRMERRGEQIPQAERERAWKMVVEAKRNRFLAELRKKARIWSIVPLPMEAPVPATEGGTDRPPAPPVPGPPGA